MTEVVRRRSRARVPIACMVLATVITLAVVITNAFTLDRVTSQVQEAQAQSADISNATREVLLLLQQVTDLGRSTTIEQVQTQRGLLVRQLSVSISSYPADAPEVNELTDVRAGLDRFPWEELAAGGNYDPLLRQSALTLIVHSERRINVLRNAEDQQFLSATLGALDANRHGQQGLSALVTIVLTLGIAGVVLMMRLSRSALAQAYDALRTEVDEREAAEDALRASEGRFRSLVQRASDLTVLTDRDGVVGYVSPAVETLLGYRPEDLLELPLIVHAEPADRAAIARAIVFLAEQPGLVHTIELRLRTRDGRTRTVEAVCQNLLDDPAVGGLVWNGRDVTDRRVLEDQLTKQAHYDPLTGLANRLLLLTRLGEALRRPSACVSVILIDLDGFKNVNDTLGHPAGDELLRAAAQRLLSNVRDTDTAARLGGDEFAVVTVVDLPEQAAAIGGRLVDVLRGAFTVAGQEVRISGSVGVAHRTGPDSTNVSAEDLLRDADIAMYVAKNAGKGRLAVFEAEMRSRALLRTSLQQQLARAVDLHEIEVHYQPIVDLHTGDVTMLEALARWRGPDGALVPADVFIPVAEETGVIMEIGREVLRQACRAAQHWRQTLPDHSELQIAVNVSLHQVLSGNLVDHVLAALQSSGLPPTALTLEITESAALEDSAGVAAQFVRLQRIGVRIAVDDFGSGYSSLGFVLGLDADTLKIDRTLLDFDTSRQGFLVTAIAALGRTLGLHVIVEGVETVQHLLHARRASCDAAQGFYFSQPLPRSDVAASLTAGSRSDAANVPGTAVDRVKR